MIPEGANVFMLKRGSKEPLDGSHGHLDAAPVDQVDLSLVPSLFNYGIALDGRFLVLDIDDPEVFYAAHPDFDPGDAWHQTTRRGHHYLYEWDGSGTNYKLPGADVKVHGFIMGPGSVVNETEYRYVGGKVREAPFRMRPRPEVSVSTSLPADESVGIESGGHDDFLYQLACWLRGRYALSESAILAVLDRGPRGVLAGTDPDNPYGPRDLARIAHSAARHPSTLAPSVDLAQTWRSGTDVEGVPSPQSDILPGFVPAGALTILYGDGKIGKSSFLSWLAARESRLGRAVVFVPSGEETFDLFVMRARLNGADDALLYEFAPKNSLLASMDALAERSHAVGTRLSLVLVDALYSHFGPTAAGENEASRARSRLSVLARFTAATGVAVLGTIHENAAGGLLGSREMRNVARSLIHAKGGRGKDFTLWSAGSNGWSPDYGVSFPGTSVPVVGPGLEQSSFVDLYGETVHQSIWKLELGPKVLPSSDVSSDDLEESTADKVRAALSSNPHLSNSDLADVIGLSVSMVSRVSGPVRESLGILPNKGGRPLKN